MTPDAVALLATVIVLLPMGYFLLAAPAFLFVKLDIPTVARLLRGMFNYYFVALATAAVIATLAFAVAGRPAFVIGIGLTGAFSIWARRWFLRQWDAQTGDTGGAALRLRRLHWGGMLGNAILLFAILRSIPYVMNTAA